MDAYEVIKRPLVTEKSTAGIPVKKYAFLVDVRATKLQIRAAVESLFGVQVDKVNTVNVRGKFKRQNRSEGYTSRAKKAYVMLKSGSKPIKELESLVN